MPLPVRVSVSDLVCRLPGKLLRKSLHDRESAISPSHGRLRSLVMVTPGVTACLASGPPRRDCAWLCGPMPQKSAGFRRPSTPLEQDETAAARRKRGMACGSLRPALPVMHPGRATRRAAITRRSPPQRLRGRVRSLSPHVTFQGAGRGQMLYRARQRLLSVT